MNFALPKWLKCIYQSRMKYGTKDTEKQIDKKNRDISGRDTSASMCRFYHLPVFLYCNGRENGS